ITRRKDKAIGVPISSIVIKTDTTGAKPRAVAKDSEEAKIKAKTEQKFECVFIKSGDKAKLRVVTTGIQDDTNIEVTSGLKKGDVIIVGPYNTVTKELKPGDKVTDKKKVNSKKQEE